MNSIKITSEKLNSLKKFDINKEISNTESTIYEIGNELLKCFNIENKEYLENKIKTIKKLNDLKSKINIKEFVYPSNLVVMNDKTIGYTLPKIKNVINLSELLNDSSINIKDKLNVLNKIGILIDKSIELERFNIKLYFKDLNEYNFLVNTETKEIYAIDLDSISLNEEKPLASYYMYDNKNLSNLQSKYRTNVYGISYPDHNSDLFCYQMMVLNTIANYKISKLNIKQFNDYLDYLLSIGFEENIITNFRKLYLNENNRNTTNEITTLQDDILEKADYKIYLNNKERTM